MTNMTKQDSFSVRVPSNKPAPPLRQPIAMVRTGLKSVGVRLFFSHFLAAVLTTILPLLLVLLLVAVSNQTTDQDSIAAQRFNAYWDTALWAFNLPVAQSALTMPAGSASDPAGIVADAVDPAILPPTAEPSTAAVVLATSELDSYTIIVDQSGKVIFINGHVLVNGKVNACTVGEAVQACLPEFTGIPAGDRIVMLDGKRTVEIKQTIATGETVFSRGAPLTTADVISWSLPGLSLYFPGLVGLTLSNLLQASCAALPVVTVIAWAVSRPLVRRISRMGVISHDFAHGHFEARVKDRRRDELGQLAGEFDSMADTLQQNVIMLRDLAAQNATLATVAERNAIVAERLRLSRDLHDSIAQRLFSLTAGTSNLPALIRQDQAQGAAYAEKIAQLAEQTMIDLRTVLLDLRPKQVLERGLVGALQAICEDWSLTTKIRVERTIILNGGYIPAGVESAIYYVAQEALNNVAKHAQATLVTVTLFEGRQQLTISITDNGIGVPIPQAIQDAGHFGLISMRERISALGGSFAVESGHHGGVTVSASLPLQQSE